MDLGFSSTVDSLGRSQILTVSSEIRETIIYAKRHCVIANGAKLMNISNE